MRHGVVWLLLAAASAHAAAPACEEADSCSAIDEAAEGRWGWRQWTGDPETACTVDEVEAADLSADAFTRIYRDAKPVVLRNVDRAHGHGAGNAQFRQLCSKGALLASWGDFPVILSTANSFSYDKTTMRLSDYVSTRMAPQSPYVSGVDTLYFFGDNDLAAWQPLLSNYKAPPQTPPEAEVGLSFGVAGRHSGVPFHRHGPGFSESIIGRKRWFLSPPHHEPLFNPNETTLQWLLHTYPLLAKDARPLECVVGEGDAIWFPSMWWHATLNLDECVFVSSFLLWPEASPEQEHIATAPQRW